MEYFGLALVIFFELCDYLGLWHPTLISLRSTLMIILFALALAVLVIDRTIRYIKKKNQESENS